MFLQTRKFYIAATVVSGKEPQARKAVSSVLPLVSCIVVFTLPRTSYGHSSGQFK